MGQCHGTWRVGNAVGQCRGVGQVVSVPFSQSWRSYKRHDWFTNATTRIWANSKYRCDPLPEGRLLYTGPPGGDHNSTSILLISESWRLYMSRGGRTDATTRKTLWYNTLHDSLHWSAVYAYTKSPCSQSRPTALAKSILRRYVCGPVCINSPPESPAPQGKSTKFIQNVEKTAKRQTYHILNTSETLYLCFANVLAQKMQKKPTKFDKK